MKKELLKNIDETIKLICEKIQKSLTDNNNEPELYYPNDTIKALASLVMARALLETEHYFSTDPSVSKE